MRKIKEARMVPKDSLCPPAVTTMKLRSAPPLLKVTEEIRATSGEVHPGWIRATGILLKGMERLRIQEAAQTVAELTS